jgi:SAM-dependent methyltransferase
VSEELPVTRWELAGERNQGYAARFTELIESGHDIDGEARLADVLVERGATILDAGSGLGRVGAALQRRGHTVVGVEKDGYLVSRCRELYPDLPVIESDILGIGPDLLRSHAAPTAYDLVVLVGNVLVLGAEGAEVRMLRTLGGLLADGGRILVGFHLTGGPVSGRDVTWPEFEAEVTEAGLRVQHHFGSYDLRPPDDEYVVAVLTGRPGRR